MSLVPTPRTIEDAPEAARPLLEGVKKQLGSVANLFGLVATSEPRAGPDDGLLEQGPETMNTLTRRLFGATLLAVPSALSLAAPALARSGHRVATVQPLAQRRIGRFTVTFLNDGFIDLPYGVFTGIDPAVLEAAAEALHLARPDGIRSPFIQWLIDDGERLVLVDTGTDGRLGPTAGRLQGALGAVGVTPADIDAVILTHLHVDHASGLVAGDRRVFEDAAVFVDRRELAHFTDPARAAAAPELLQSSFAQAARVVELYPDLERIDVANGERELFPGVSIVDLTGHTPGHVGVRIADGGQSLMLVGDMLFNEMLHPGRAATGIAFEEDPAAAQRMRERFFPLAAGEALLVANTHMPFPGVGRIVRDGRGFTWLAADWEYPA